MSDSWSLQEESETPDAIAANAPRESVRYQVCARGAEPLPLYPDRRKALAAARALAARRNVTVYRFDPNGATLVATFDARGGADARHGAA